MAEGTPLILEGRFRVLRPAGTGATANVYLAEEVSTGAKVAVKVLKRSLLRDEEMVARFEREAALHAQLQHPNIVRLLAFEKAKEGHLLFLEWVEGPRLDELLAQGELTTARALRLLVHLASALSAIHLAGIVHRDLKPENLIIEQRDDGPRLRLLDFGIARFTDPSMAKNQFQSFVGMVAGTPSYLSPEQASGKPLEASADVYSFGVLAYRLLSGALPFSADEGQSDYDIILKHLNDKPPKLVPSDQSLKGGTLVKLVMKCLEKKPSARPTDGTELLDALATAIRDTL